MKNKTIPITMLRDTGAIDELVNSSENPIVVTKNGYEDFTIIPKNYSQKEGLNNPVIKNNNFGFYRIKTMAIDPVVGDIKTNALEVASQVEKAKREEVDVLVFQELTLIGKSSEDLPLFSSNNVALEEGLDIIKKSSEKSNMIIAVGCPISVDFCIFNSAVLIQNGRIIGIYAKANIETNIASYEGRIYSPFVGEDKEISLCGQRVTLTNKSVFKNLNDERLVIKVEIGNELFNHPILNKDSNRPSLIINLGGYPAENMNLEVLENQVKSKSLAYKCAYVYADGSYKESSSGHLFRTQSLICENGYILNRLIGFNEMYIIADIDIELLSQINILEKPSKPQSIEDVHLINFNLTTGLKTDLIRPLNPHPFLPDGDSLNVNFVKNTMDIQAHGLANRMRKINCKKAVLGLSGGLDSALAILVTVEAFKILQLPSSEIYAFSMPCFGTTDRTKNNSEKLANLLGVNFKEINIGESVSKHLQDLEVSEENRSVAFENAQARERTQFLMDYANLVGGIVVGTGDLSELALGWCTFNGDQMSMYDPNAGVSKTLVKYLVEGYGIVNPKLSEVLSDIVGTPISPELLPGSEGNITQLTEDNIGPYELQDFYIYNFIKYRFSPSKLLYLSSFAFKGRYSDEEQLKWLKVFLKRFFSSQFKRNAIPDGPRVCDIDLSPKGSLRLPSDLSYSRFLNELESRVEE